MSTRLEAFIADERNQYPHSGVNLFAFALGQAARYDGFLCIILSRYSEIGADLHNAFSAFTSRLSTAGTHTLSEEDTGAWTRQIELTNLMDLEIESFYLFAKIFLDHIARFIEEYFGRVRGLSLDSHDDLTKSFQKFKNAKHLSCGDAFQQNLVELKNKIADYRDYQIAHSKNPRITHGTTFGPNNAMKIKRIPLFPTMLELQAMQDGVQSESESLFDLRAALDAYIEKIISLIADNREKSRYLKPSTVTNQAAS
ncbi:MAG: hypothetical protein WA807_01210 [Steroidobacteraceae bacterium]